MRSICDSCLAFTFAIAPWFAFAGNDVGDEGAKALADALKSSSNSIWALTLTCEWVNLG